MNTSGTIIELNNELNKEEVALVEKFLLNMTDAGYVEIYKAKEYSNNSCFAHTIAEEINQMNADDFVGND